MDWVRIRGIESMYALRRKLLVAIPSVDKLTGLVGETSRLLKLAGYISGLPFTAIHHTLPSQPSSSVTG
jgi:hypothetical protein